MGQERGHHTESLTSLLIRDARGWPVTASLSVAVVFKQSCHCLLASGAPKWRRHPREAQPKALCPLRPGERQLRAGAQHRRRVGHTCFPFLGGTPSSLRSPKKPQPPRHPEAPLGLLEQRWGHTKQVM